MAGKRAFILAVAIAPISVGIAYLAAWLFTSDEPDARNYQPVWQPPKGWVELEWRPFFLARYRHEADGATISLAAQHMAFASRIGPEETTETFTLSTLSLIARKQRQWAARRMPDIVGKQRFSLIAKKRVGQTMYQAFCVKGNSTIIANLVLRSSSARENAARIAEFDALVRGMDLKVSDQSHGVELVSASRL